MSTQGHSAIQTTWTKNRGWVFSRGNRGAVIRGKNHSCLLQYFTQQERFLNLVFSGNWIAAQKLRLISKPIRRGNPAPDYSHGMPMNS